MCILKKNEKKKKIIIIPSLSKEYIVGGPIWAGMNFFFIKTRTRITPLHWGQNELFFEKFYVFKIGWKPIDLKTKLKHLTKAWQRRQWQIIHFEKATCKKSKTSSQRYDR